MAEEEKDAKKKPRRRARKPKEAEAEAAAVEATEADAAEDEAPVADEPEAEAAAPEAAEGEESKPARRGSAETSTTVHKTSEPPRDASGAVVVRARARYVRSAPRKARLVMDHIRGKRVQDAVAMLNHTPRAASRDILKLLNSAIANAENNHELGIEELRVHRATVDEGPTIKRYRPRALGRATPIHKRTSHMTITLTTTEGTE